MPHDGESVAASTARILNAGGPPCWRYSFRMSGVLAKKFGRMQVAAGPDSSSMYSVSSSAVLRQVK